MSNPCGNPEIKAIGKLYRFGAPLGANPAMLARLKNPQSIRVALRRFAAMSALDFRKVIQSPQNLTMAQIIAAKKFQKAMAGDLNVMQQIENAIDGKLK